MLLLASPIIDWTAMWKIVVAALVAGAGVVILFGLMLLGLKLSQGKAKRDAGANGNEAPAPAEPPSSGARVGGFTLALVCALGCVGIIALGVYAMTQKPSSKPAKPKSALVTPAGSRVRLIASSR
jgi:hypothetical protein